MSECVPHLLLQWSDTCRALADHTPGFAPFMPKAAVCYGPNFRARFTGAPRRVGGRSLQGEAVPTVIRFSMRTGTSGRAPDGVPSPPGAWR